MVYYIKIAYFDAVNINKFNFNLHDGFRAFNINNIFMEKLAEDLATDTPNVSWYILGQVAKCNIPL